MEPLDPQVATLVATMQSAGVPHLTTLSPAQARAMAAARAEGAPAGPDMHEVRDLSFDGPAGPIAARLYAPSPDPSALVAYFHGGGWVIGDLDTHDAIVRRLASDTGCAFIAVDYRLAPEHPFPAAVEDAWAGLLEVGRLGHRLFGPALPRAVAGDSAGATLAAVCAILARGAGTPRLDAQLLLYPALSGRMDSRSFRAGDAAPILDSASMRWFWDHYAPGELRQDWRAAPLEHPDLSGLPPALVVTAGHDPLLDEGVAYAARLGGAGVHTVLQNYATLPHGFAGLGPVVATAGSAMGEIGATFRAMMPATPADRTITRGTV